MRIPTQKEIWDEKRAKLQFYRQARETPLGYVPNNKKIKTTNDLPVCIIDSLISLHLISLYFTI